MPTGCDNRALLYCTGTGTIFHLVKVILFSALAIVHVALSHFSKSILLQKRRTPDHRLEQSTNLCIEQWFLYTSCAGDIEQWCAYDGVTKPRRILCCNCTEVFAFWRTISFAETWNFAVSCAPLIGWSRFDETSLWTITNFSKIWLLPEKGAMITGKIWLDPSIDTENILNALIYKNPVSELICIYLEFIDFKYLVFDVVH